MKRKQIATFTYARVGRKTEWLVPTVSTLQLEGNIALTINN
jgi:hypothetical protein